VSTENPFLGHRVPMSAAVRAAGVAYGQADLGEVTLSYVHGPAHGPPLLLLPAQMGTWETYAEALPRLAAHFRPFAVDLRGHGASSWTPGRYDWDVVGGDLVRFLEQVVGEPAVVSGNSSGGVLAVWLAARRPDLVRAVVVEDAPVFSTEWPRFRDRDRFVYAGLVHAVDALADLEHRRLADYFRGQGLPVSERRVKRMPDWLCRWLQHDLDRYAAAHPGEPAGLAGRWPARLGELFRSLSMFDPDFARAFVDGRFYVDFDHAEAVAAIGCPVTLMHADWHRYERWGLVGAMDGADAQRFCRLAPQTVYLPISANHVIHRGRTLGAFVDGVLRHAG
jgi:pimeloyl-ACP methyl ester carboxylesterase